MWGEAIRERVAVGVFDVSSRHLTFGERRRSTNRVRRSHPSTDSDVGTLATSDGPCQVDVQRQQLKTKCVLGRGTPMRCRRSVIGLSHS